MDRSAVVKCKNDDEFMNVMSSFFFFHLCKSSSIMTN